MAKKREYQGYQLIVKMSTGYAENRDPTTREGANWLSWRQRDADKCARIVRLLEDVESVDVDCIIKATCSHCGCAWTEDSETFNGGCCDADMEAAPAETPAPVPA